MPAFPLSFRKAFSEGKVPKCNFDPKQYNREAVEEFENAIM